MRETPRAWMIGPGRELALDRPRVMGILNLTPDSFSDGGALASVDAAVARTGRMIQEGAEMIDVGGESTRPGAARVEGAEQLRRIVPVIRGIRERLGPEVLVSVDTTRCAVARGAMDAGADAINDVSGATEDEGMLRLAAERGAGIVLMHRLKPPGADVFSHEHAAPPAYEGGVVESVRGFLESRAEAAMRAGVDRAAIVLDPGLGFGKSVAQNLELIDRTGEIAALGFPVLSGLSRKSFTAVYGGLGVELPARERLTPTLELSARHWRAGAAVFRVHDVREHAQMFGTIEPDRK